MEQTLKEEALEMLEKHDLDVRLLWHKVAVGRDDFDKQWFLNTKEMFFRYGIEIANLQVQFRKI